MRWKSDILTEFDLFETGLSRFVQMDKPNFVGKQALAVRQNAGPNKRLVTIEIEGRDAPAHGGASVMLDGRVVGTITSGDWGHRLARNLALAFADPDLTEPDTKMLVDFIEHLTPAHVIEFGPYDPDMSRVRA